jgi:hypothetical protein
MANRILREPLRRATLNSSSQPETSRKAAPPKRRVLRLNAVGFKPHPHPSQKGGVDDEHEGKEQIQQYSFKVLADMSLKAALGDDVLSETAWARVNPRGRKPGGPVLDAIEQTWKDYPSEFYRINRGTLLSAESVTWDKNSKLVEIVFTDMEKHGIVDGAHTLAKLVDDLIPETYGPEEDGEDLEDGDDDSEEESSSEEQRTPDRYLTCEVWVGLKKEEVVRLTAGRNTSRTVPPFAISNLRGDFRAVQETLEKVKPEFAVRVAFKPNEHMHIESLSDDDEPTYKPLSALNILQLMMCMDATNYSDTDHPIEAYKNQGFIPKFWDKTNPKNRIGEYTKMLPVLGDLLELYDTIREVIPEVYDERTTHLSKIPRRWNKVLARKPKQRVENKRPESLYYLDPTGERKTFRSPTALFYPIMCAFRACLDATGNKYEWLGKKKPTAWDQSVFREVCLSLAVTIASLAKHKDSLHAVGRDEAVWAACYKTLNSSLFEFGIKSRR